MGAQDYDPAPFKRHVDALAGMFYRMDKGVLTGRNAESTAATVRRHYDAARSMVAADARTDEAPLCGWLDAHERYAAKWNRVERRMVGATS